MFKKINTFSLAVILIISSLGLTPVSAKQGDIVILYTNDTHCEIDSELSFADISAIEAIEQAKGNEVVIIDAGDAIQGATIGAISKGEYIIEIMNEVGYDAAALGNHEFDYQIPRLMELSELADFPYICANFVLARDSKSLFAPYHMINIGDTDIAFVSAVTPHTITDTAPAYFQDEDGEFLYSFCNAHFFDIFQKSVDDIRKNGADIVIALTHLGVNDADSPYTSKELIAATSGIDVVLDAHSHTVIENEQYKNKNGENVILSSTGSKFQNIGMLNISNEEISTKLINKEYKKDGIPPEGESAYNKTNGFIAAIKTKYELELEKKIATSDVELTINNPEKYSPETGVSREVRCGETNLGDFCADAYKALLGCDIAIINGGGVRADVKKGDVSYGDLLDVNPFGNDLCVIEVTGRQLLDALEHGAKSYPDEDGAFLQVSGLSYEIDENVPTPVLLDDNGIFKGISGERRVKNVKVDGVLIDEAALYTLGGSNFTLLNCGDGFSMFEGATLIKDLVCTDLDALIKYANETLGGVIGDLYENPHGSGRIKILSKPATFDDILNHWAKETIENAVQKGLMKGVSENKFAPELEISRGMFVTILYRAQGEPAAPKINFADVPNGQYYTESVAWAYANGIINGKSEAEFAPNANITREQMAVILFRYFVKKEMDFETPDEYLVQFKDNYKISEYAVSALNWAVGTGIIKGKETGILDPLGKATRAEAAAMFVRILNTIK